ncbi:SusC/RagA family TonB-linked outer membrane protein [Sphingobacterium deserti]|uniref:TonB-dependent receptor plug n=1 Tax=Sphingobacterium deserti TaxID=1229276 RepID=A0A0B8T0Y7_9SPHI|nr:SusC/RagA family TonB-linked outer membrane protein [Sphingobacterium deserti]KGE14201.1 TonB-dependent receptor plug [Sphingobacterium deserti]
MNKNLLFIRIMMRTTIIIYLIGLTVSQLLLAAPLSGQVHLRKVDFSVSNTNLYAAIKKLQAEHGIDMAFDDKALNLVNIEVRQQAYRATSVDAVLKSLFAGTALTYEEKADGTLVLKKQQRPGRITGVITDSQGEPLAAASVQIVELNRTVIADADGRFTISAAPGTYTLTARYISFETMSKSKITVSEGSTSTVDFALLPTTGDLEEVVVTALGITREKKALGYAATEVKGEDIAQTMPNNWSEALSGRVAGVNLVRSGAGPAGSNKIILRGENNLTGSNEALIVIDGVMVSQSSGRQIGNGSGAYLGGDSPTDFGTGINDINPEDIETLTVLKGPNATALYGERGGNGAIVITTKSGRARKGIGVTITSNATMESISRWPDYQYEYGQGTEGVRFYSFNAGIDGASTRSTSSAWGPKFDGQYFFQYDPVTQTRATERTLWQAYPNERKNFFDTGTTFTNSVSLDGGNAKTQIRFSFTDLRNKWIIPNTGYERNNVSLTAGHSVTDKLRIQTRINYRQNRSDNLPSTGYNNQSLMYWNAFWQPNASLDWLTDYWRIGQENILQNYPFSSLVDNPYLITNEMLNKNKRHGLTGSVDATYQFSKNWDILVRTTMDLNAESRSQQRPWDTEKFRKGMYRTQSINSSETTSDVMLTYKKEITPDLKLRLTAGGSTRRRESNLERNNADSLAYPGIFNLGNAAGNLVSMPHKEEQVTNSLYALGTLSFKEFLFADFSFRNDWNSALASPINKGDPFQYPSLNLSFVLSDVVRLPKQFSLVKFRGSIAGVGSGSDVPYVTSYNYLVESIFPGGRSNPTRMPNYTLEPLYTTSYEAGADVSMFAGRFSVNMTYYTSKTSNQHLTATVDRSSGASTILVNAGLIQNSGLEIESRIMPIRNENFQWTMSPTFSTNKNKVLELTDELREMILQNGPGSRGAIIAKVGARMDDLYGRGYERAPDGQIVYENGIPQLTDTMQYIGQTNPAWRVGLHNEFRYKQFRLGFMFDAQFGAVGYSLTSAVHGEQGKTRNTLPGRYNGIIGNGVIANGDGTYRPNDVIATNVWDYYNAHLGRDNVEGTSYSTDFLKLRELRFDYTLSPSVLSHIGLQRASVGVFGRDLFIWSSWPAFDPEFGTLGNGDITRGFELGQFPATRTFGVNLVIGL